MKIRNLTSLSLAVFLLALFLPVFGFVLFAGTNMDYNEIHKIDTLCSNPVLLLGAVPALALFAVLYVLLDKIPLNTYTKAGTVILSFILCAALCAVKMEISKCIAVYGAWDCGNVANSARWFSQGKGLGYEDYYYIYSNNVPMAWLLYILYQFSGSMPGYPYNPEFIWIQFQCVMFSLAVFMSAMTILLVTRKIAATALGLLTGILMVGLCPWQAVLYTDPVTIAMPVMVLFLYALFRRMRHKGRYLIWFLLILAGMAGGIMKATCYVALLAVLAVDVIWLLSEREGIIPKCKKMGVRIFLLALGCVAAVWCRAGIYRTLDYIPDHDLEMTWTNFFYNGLNESTTGSYSIDGLVIAKAYAGYPRRFRQSVELHYAWDRIVEKGPLGLMDFWLRKQVMNFNDGTFSWFQEGGFDMWEYENITNGRWKEALRSFYWAEGDHYRKFVTWSQGIWIFVLTGIVAQAVFAVVSVFREREHTEERCIHSAGILIFIGMFFFVLLFEGRARYLLNYVPVFMTMAVTGYTKLILLFTGSLSYPFKRPQSRVNHAKSA